MTQKYERVLSDDDRHEIRQKYIGGFIGRKPVCLIKITEQAVLAKLQPQLDAIGAGGVSGQRITGRSENKELRIVCCGVMPDLRFVEVENEKGESVNIGKWRSRDDGYTELVINSALPEPSHE